MLVLSASQGAFRQSLCVDFCNNGFEKRNFAETFAPLVLGCSNHP